jgi:hypothetical protein
MRTTWILASIAAFAVFLPAACGGASSSTTTSSTGTGGSSTTTSTTGSTTSTGAGGDTTGTGGRTVAAVCDAPAQSPSKGACFQPGSGGMGGAGGGTTTTTTTTTTSGGTGGSGGAGGAGGAGGSGGVGGTGGAPPMCTMILQPGACATCLEGDCCGELATCDGAGDCLACVIGQETNPAKCNAEPAKTAALAFTACLDAHCKALCTPKQCNPLTNEGCNAAAGEACDLGQTGFRCYAGPNDQEICAACDGSSGPFCKPGMHCMADGACAHYCCDDGDCGTGVCDKSVLAHPDIGVCLHKE